MKFIHLWIKKKDFFKQPNSTVPALFDKTQSCKNTLTGLFELGVKTLVFCVECRTTLLVEMSLCTTRYLYICKHVQ